MTCRSCGATIADKAIVCYRCGTPTADPAALAPRRPPPRRPAVLPWLLMAILVAVGVWVVAMPPAQSAVRWVAWAALIVLAVLTVFVARRR